MTLANGGPQDPEEQTRAAVVGAFALACMFFLGQLVGCMAAWALR